MIIIIKNHEVLMVLFACFLLFCTIIMLEMNGVWGGFIDAIKGIAMGVIIITIMMQILWATKDQPASDLEGNSTQNTSVATDTPIKSLQESNQEKASIEPVQ